jgi:hypothetical protein
MGEVGARALAAALSSVEILATISVTDHEVAARAHAALSRLTAAAQPPEVAAVAEVRCRKWLRLSGALVVLPLTPPTMPAASPPHRRAAFAQAIELQLVSTGCVSSFDNDGFVQRLAEVTGVRVANISLSVTAADCSAALPNLHSLTLPKMHSRGLDAETMLALEGVLGTFRPKQPRFASTKVLNVRSYKNLFSSLRGRRTSAVCPEGGVSSSRSSAPGSARRGSRGGSMRSLFGTSARRPSTNAMMLGHALTKLHNDHSSFTRRLSRVGERVSGHLSDIKKELSDISSITRELSRFSTGGSSRRSMDQS